jgi:hypothetical protein
MALPQKKQDARSKGMDLLQEFSDGLMDMKRRAKKLRDFLSGPREPNPDELQEMAYRATWDVRWVLLDLVQVMEFFEKVRELDVERFRMDGS